MRRLVPLDSTTGARTGIARFIPSRSDRVQAAIWLLVFAVTIQIRAVAPLSPDLGWYLLLIAILGAVAGTLIFSALPRAIDSTPDVLRRALPGTRLAVPCAAIGIAFALAGAFVQGTHPWDAQWFWLAGMGVALFGPLLDRVMSWRGTSRPDVRRYGRDAAMAAVLFLVALALRAPDILASPPSLFGDEASCGLYGRLFNAGHTPLLSISWYGLPMLSYAVSGLGLRLFGDNMIGLREIDAVIGAAAVVLTYFLGKEWFGRRAGVLAALVLSVSFLHLELSRDGLHYIQGPTSITLTLLLTTIWLKRGGVIPALLSGMSMILSLQVYWSARMGPILVAGLLVYLALFRRRLLLGRLPELAWTVAGVVIAGLPVWALFHNNPGTFNGHQGSVLIFSNDPNTKGHLISQYGHISMVELVLQQAWRVLTTFNARGDASPLFGAWPGTLLDGITACLLPAAIVLALCRWRRWEYVVLLAWFWTIVVAGIITIDPPIWPRLAALTPAVALLAGMLLGELWTALEGVSVKRWLIVAGMVTLLGAITVNNLRAAFVDFPTASLQMNMEATYVGRFLANAPDAGHTVLLSDGSMYVGYEPVQFLAPKSGGCTLMPGQPLSACPMAAESRLFVLLPGREKDLRWLEQQKPGGRVVTVGVYSNGSARILAYELA